MDVDLLVVVESVRVYVDFHNLLKVLFLIIPLSILLLDFMINIF